LSGKDFNSRAVPRELYVSIALSLLKEELNEKRGPSDLGAHLSPLDARKLGY